jgi:selenocysteine lyase/cysteine desulfurase
MVSPLRLSNFHAYYTNLVGPNLCSGSYGSVPIPVSAAAEATLKSIEGNVDIFLKLQVFDYLNPARHRMAKFVGAGPDEIVFVPNTSHGLNTVLRNLVWNEGDLIVTGKRWPSRLRVRASHFSLDP